MSLAVGFLRSAVLFTRRACRRQCLFGLSGVARQDMVPTSEEHTSYMYLLDDQRFARY